MKRNLPVLLMIVTVGSICAAFVVYQPVARAYELPSSGELPAPAVLTATGSAQNYDFSTSFGNLISPFENFFNSMKGNNAVPLTLNLGGGNASSGITVAINVQQYINQYSNELDAWSYEHTGVHIQWVLSIIVNIFYWIFGLANSAVQWIAGLFH